MHTQACTTTCRHSQIHTHASHPLPTANACIHTSTYTQHKHKHTSHTHTLTHTHHTTHTDTQIHTSTPHTNQLSWYRLYVECFAYYTQTMDLFSAPHYLPIFFLLIAFSLFLPLSVSRSYSLCLSQHFCCN